MGRASPAAAPPPMPPTRTAREPAHVGTGGTPASVEPVQARTAGYDAVRVLTALREACHRGLANGKAEVNLAGLAGWLDRNVEGLRDETAAGSGVVASAAVGPSTAAPEVEVDGWIGTGTAAGLLGVTPQRVRQLAAAGRLGVVRAPAGWRLSRAEVEARADGQVRGLRADGAGGDPA